MPLLRSALLLVAVALPGAPPEGGITFRSDVQRVLVPVVVRDGNGRIVSDLKREEFRLLDEGKEQAIVDFTVEGRRNEATPDEPPDLLGERSGVRRAPRRFLVYFFDDRNISFQDLEQARSALHTHLSRGLPTDTLAALATSSGFSMPFTRDADALLKAARDVKATVSTQNGLGCPEISYYVADLIVNKGDPAATRAAANQVGRCGPQVPWQLALGIARTVAENVLRIEHQQTATSLQMLAESMARLSAVRGTRELVMVSTGLQLVGERPLFERLLERAVTQGIRVSALNAHGVHGTGMDMSGAGPLNSYTVAALRWRSDTLATMAETTGGRYLHQTNALKQALDQIAMEPETTYVLGFTPSAAGRPGAFRKLEVRIAGRRGLQVQARRGYVHHSASEPPSPIQTARAALMSLADMRALPLEVSARRIGTHTSVMVRLPAEGVNLNSCERQSCSSLIFVFGLFDENGVLLQEVVRKADLRLDEKRLEAFRQKGLQIAAEFPSPPPRYLARVAAVETTTGRVGTGSP